MYIDTDQYEIATNLGVDEVLSDLPLTLMKENIKEQIDNPLSTNTNYLNIILEKYDALLDQCEDNPDAYNEVKHSLYEFCSYVLGLMNDRFGLEISSDIEYNDITSITDVLYTFFVIKFQKNVVKFFYKYIKENKRSISDAYDRMSKKKDVTTINYKKQLKNKDDVIILANLPSIIDYVKSLDIDPVDFITLVSGDGNSEYKMIKSLIKHGRMTGDFVNNYLSIVFDENEYVVDDIQVDVKMKLLKKIT